MRVIEKTSWSASSDVSVLPVIPCFVLDTTATEFWYVTATESVKVSGGGGGAVSGVKGDAESTYRTGNVNLTPANIGALALSGGTVTGMINRAITGGISYIDSWDNNAPLIRLTKTEGSNIWRPIIALRTKGGGGWAIGNYDDETLEFVYGTKANIESSTNTTTQIYFTSAGGANFPGTIQQNGTNVSLSGHTHAASDVTSGAFHADRIPALPTSRITNLGEVKNGGSTGSSVNVANSAYATLCSVALPVGNWVIVYHVTFPTNATGRRYISLDSVGGTSAPAQAYARMTAQSSPAVSGGGTSFNGAQITSVTASNFSIYLKAWQNSGGVLACYGYIRAIRIR